MKRNAKILAAAVVLACVGIGLWQLIPTASSGRAYAVEIAVASRLVEEAKTVTWKTTFYPRRNSKDGVGGLLLEVFGTRECAYKSPGLYREVSFNDKGQVSAIDINDTIHGKRLLLDTKKKQAKLFHLREPMFDPRGPFVKPMEWMKRENLKSLGKKAIAGREAIGFRHAFVVPQENEKWSLDFWIDAEAKRLVAYQVPGLDLIDPDQVYKDSKPGTGFRMFDIAFGVKLDDSLFNLEPSDGFTLEVVGAPVITEKEAVEFLGLVAESFDKTFPEQMPHFGEGTAREKLLIIERKPEADLTTAEKKLLEARQKYLRPDGPMAEFIEQIIEKGSWKYLGGGVKLGDKSQIVCWYKLGNSKMYRVVFGDLSIKDLSPSELPLPVE